jgi:predicted Zn-dependent protease
MIRVMEVLAKGSGGSSQPEFMSTHPAPENRAERIKEAIAKRFPQGAPKGLGE